MDLEKLWTNLGLELSSSSTLYAVVNENGVLSVAVSVAFVFLLLFLIMFMRRRALTPRREDVDYVSRRYSGAVDFPHPQPIASTPQPHPSGHPVSSPPHPSPHPYSGQQQSHPNPQLHHAEAGGAPRPAEMTADRALHAPLGWLELLDGNSAPVAITSKTARIGRDTANHIVLDNMTVHRDHAVLNFTLENRFELVDLGGANGCVVNGERCARRELQDGDVIELGAVRLRYRAQR